MDVFVGTYTGDGNDDRAITGVGFQPVMVLIKGNTTQHVVYRTSGFPGDLSHRIANASTTPAANFIQSLGSDGFTIGSDSVVNANGVDYHYLAVGGTDIGVVAYTGDGNDNRSITGLGFQPDMAWVSILEASSHSVRWRTADMPSGESARFISSNETNVIQALEADGIQVGTSSGVNTNGSDYTFVGFQEAAGVFAVFTYTGDGNDNRSISGLGFEPAFVAVKRYDEASRFGALRFAGQTGDASFLFDDVAEASNLIQALEADGFQVGTATPSSVNVNGAAYYGFAFAATDGGDSATGTGAATMGAVTASGTGIMQPSGSGAVTLGALTADGDGMAVLDATGTGAVALGALTADGEGTSILNATGTGAVTLGPLTADGDGLHIEDATGTGAVALGAATADGDGALGLAATGGVELGALTASGTGVRTVDPAAYELAVDLDRSALFDDDEVITGDVVNAVVSTERGHDLTRVLSPPIAGVASFTLLNNDGDYSYGSDLKAGREMRFRTTFDGTRYDVWRGFLDTPVQTPPGGSVQMVSVQCFGNLARLAGRNVSTELYENISTGAAIEHLLNAAGFPRNVQGYLDSLSPVGGWNLASTSGDDPDTSGNGNDASFDSATRGAATLDDSGTLSAEFNGGAGWALVADVADVEDIFATGGLVACLFNADSDGGNDVGTLIAKSDHANYVYRFYVADQSGSTMRLRFHHETSGSDGVWQTDRIVTVGRTYLVGLYFDRSLGAAANPTIWLADIEAEEFNEYTVGAGITETSTPSGTPSADGGYDLIIGMTDATGLSATFDGRIGTVRVYGDVGDATYWAPKLRTAAARAEAAMRHIEDGETEIEWWWLDNEDALAALEMLKNSEGPGAALYEDGEGAIVFKGRHARNMDARSTTIQTTFNTGAGAEPRIGFPFEYDPGLLNVVNVCEIDTVRREAQAIAEVWALGEQAVLAPGETKMFVARSSGGDPFTGAVVPNTGDADYTVAVGSVASVTLDRTSGASVVISITAGAGGATISGLRLRAELVEVTNSTRAANTIDTTASQEEYGVHTYSIPVRPEIGFSLAQDFCNAIVSFYSDGRPTARITLQNLVELERMYASLEREVSDRVRLVVGDEIDQEMYVEHIRHEIHPAGYHVTTYGLSQALGVTSYFTLDESVLDGVDVLAF